MLGPIVRRVKAVTEPIQPLIDVLTAPIPVISDLAGDPITLIDLAGAFGYVDPGMIKSIADIISLVNRFDADVGELWLPLGEVIVIPDGGKAPEGMPSLTDPNTDPADLFDYLMQPENKGAVRDLVDEAGGFKEAMEQHKVTGDAADVLGGISDGSTASGFSLPIWDNPGSAIGLLFGKDVVLVAYDMEPLVFEFEWSQFFSIFGPLGVSINAGIGVTIDLAFGYDTYGIRRFVEGDFRNPLLLFEGFYISDTDLPTGDFGTDVPELVVSGEVSAAAELNLGVARAGVAGGIGLTIEFDLNDPDNDGRVRITEIVGNIWNQLNAPDIEDRFLAPLAPFDVHGEIFARLFAFLKIDLFFFEIDKEWNITPPITLIEFDIPFYRPAKLGTELTGSGKAGGDDLLLNTGEAAKDRLRGGTTDGGEHFVIKKKDADTVLVWAPSLGINEAQAQEYDVSSKIIVDAGEGDDTITFDGVDWEVEVDAGSGNDLIQFINSPVNADSVTIKGGVGDDTILSGAGNDLLIGDQGQDSIDGGGGDDIILGDAPRYEEDLSSIRGLTSPLDGNDTSDGRRRQRHDPRLRRHRLDPRRRRRRLHRGRCGTAGPQRRRRHRDRRHRTRSRLLRRHDPRRRRIGHDLGRQG